MLDLINKSDRWVSIREKKRTSRVIISLMFDVIPKNLRRND